MRRKLRLAAPTVTVEVQLQRSYTVRRTQYDRPS